MTRPGANAQPLGWRGFDKLSHRHQRCPQAWARNEPRRPRPWPEEDDAELVADED